MKKYNGNVLSYEELELMIAFLEHFKEEILDDMIHPRNGNWDATPENCLNSIIYFLEQHKVGMPEDVSTI